jgi:hypothetical protein
MSKTRRPNPPKPMFRMPKIVTDSGRCLIVFSSVASRKIPRNQYVKPRSGRMVAANSRVTTRGLGVFFQCDDSRCH